MRSIFSFLSMGFIIFGFGQISLLVFSMSLMYSSTYQSITDIVTDAAELSMDDDFRMDGVSFLNEGYAFNYINSGINALSEDLNGGQPSSNIKIDDIKITNLVIEPGKYDIFENEDHERAVNSILPSIYLEVCVDFRVKSLYDEISVTTPMEIRVSNDRLDE